MFVPCEDVGEEWSGSVVAGWAHWVMALVSSGGHYGVLIVVSWSLVDCN